MDVQTGLALYWWQRLITFDLSREKKLQIAICLKIMSLCYTKEDNNMGFIEQWILELSPNFNEKALQGKNG